MREIKFRGRTSCMDKNDWVYGDLHIISKKPHIHSVDSNCPFAIETNTIGQYTGLKDKNGREIYEGDIIATKYNDEMEIQGFGIAYNEVVFRDGSFGYMGDITGDFFSFSNNYFGDEVIAGNIHDNPKLLTLNA